MLRVSLIGPGNIDYHYYHLLNISKNKFKSEMSKIAKALVDAGVEIVFLPDSGATFELAKLYKRFGGKKVYASVPLQGTDLGIKHLNPQINYKENGKKIIDEVINSGDWYKQTFYLATFGDIVLMLGFSLGSIGELSLSYYMHKVFLGHKRMGGVKREQVHKEIRAGKNVPFSVVIYRPFVKGRLNKEIEEYIKKHEGKVYYVENADKLYSILNKLNKNR